MVTWTTHVANGASRKQLEGIEAYKKSVIKALQEATMEKVPTAEIV